METKRYFIPSGCLVTAHLENYLGLLSVSFILVLICVVLYLQVWFLGENANYAASEYAWESATPPGTALMMLDADKMVAAASSRNPTLAGALTRLQRCAFSGSWEVKLSP